MSARTKLTIVLTAIAGLSFTATGLVAPVGAQEASPTITINPSGGNPYTFEPAALEAKVGQEITVKNNDPSGVHSVTAKDRSFSVDVSPKSSATFKVSKAGKYDYICQYHTDAHNPASLNIS
jgi:plastocyanin